MTGLMSPLLEKFEAMLTVLFPDVPRGGLRAGASLADIAAVEAHIGLRYPEELKAACLFANGSTTSVFPRFQWMEMTAEVMAAWDIQQEIEARDRPSVLWSPWNRQLDEAGGFCYHCPVDVKRIPIGESFASSTLYLDLNPARGGWMGQVIEVDYGQVKWWAPSFSAFLQRWIELFETNEIVYLPRERRWAQRDEELAIYELFAKPWRRN